MTVALRGTCSQTGNHNPKDIPTFIYFLNKDMHKTKWLESIFWVLGCLAFTKKNQHSAFMRQKIVANSKGEREGCCIHNNSEDWRDKGVVASVLLCCSVVMASC